LQRLQAVVRAVAPKRAAFPQQSLDLCPLAVVSALAEAPMIDGEHGDAERRQDRAIGRRLQRRAALQQFVLADGEVVAVSVTVQDECARLAIGWQQQQRRDGFFTVQRQSPAFDASLRRDLRRE
jgi:hypothetical protein